VCVVCVWGGGVDMQAKGTGTLKTYLLEHAAPPPTLLAYASNPAVRTSSFISRSMRGTKSGTSLLRAKSEGAASGTACAGAPASLH
jgi:hypothetical protein